VRKKTLDQTTASGKKKREFGKNVRNTITF
jgi:hypothetical protein